MQAHQLLSSKKGSRRIGRGGKRGSFSGRGIKGQKSRAGRRVRPQVRDIIKKLHKRRGYGKNRGRSVIGSMSKITTINTRDINRVFADGDHITLQKLIDKGLAKKKQTIKILGGVELNKKVTFDTTLPLSLALRKKLGL